MKLHELLNKQVANYAVMYVKVHHYHWYVKGHSFFALHQKLDDLYNEVADLYDSFAERLIMIGGKPATSLKNYLAMTSLNEATEVEVDAMIAALVDDLRLLVTELKEVIDVAEKDGDDSTADLATTTISALQKHIWQYSAFLL